MSSNYPPGVTGNEWQIVGDDLACHRCGHPADPDAALPLCDKCIDLWHRFTEPGYGRHGYCEDYPCCGHTPDDPCDGTGYVSAEQILENPAKYHLGCDHETGGCDYEPEDDDEEDES